MKLRDVSRFQLAVVALMFAAGAFAYPYLPARIPTHWNVSGEIDNWATTNPVSVFLIPVIALGLVGLAVFLPNIDPLKRNYEKFMSTYYYVIDLIIAFFAFLYGLTLYAAFDNAVSIGTAVPLGIGLMLAALGNRLGKVKKNFFLGIKTPWTLASETVWNRTHRIAAKLFFVGGIVAALTAFLPAPYNFAAFITVVIGISVAATLVSYVIYHSLEKRGQLSDRIDQQFS